MKQLKVMLTVLALTVFISSGLLYAMPELAGQAPAGHTGGAAAELTGKVLETVDSGGYTYVRIEKDGERKWVAIPQTEIEKGAEVTFNPGTPMKDFISQSLGRKFSTIYFSPGIAQK